MASDPLAFFVANYGRARVALIGMGDALGRAVRAGQSGLTTNGQPSLWSHAFLLGDLRIDRRGAGGALSTSPYLLESDLHVSPIKEQVRNGAQENWVGKWCTSDLEHVGIFDFNLSPSEADLVLGTALQLIGEELQYPIAELVGTWLAIVLKRTWARNPFNDPHALYCSAFVRYCYQQAGRDFMATSPVDLSNTAPEHVAQSGKFLAEWHR